METAVSDPLEESDITSRVLITVEQMEGLVSFIEQNPMLAKGKTKPKHLSQKLWAQCTKKLNTYKDGAKKNSKQWAKSWTDIKYRVRRKALELQAARAEGKPLPEDHVPLSQIEERILSVTGKHTLEDVIIKSDPRTSDTDSLQDSNILHKTNGLTSPVVPHSTSLQSDSEDHVEDDPPPLATSQRIKRTTRKRRQSPRETSDDRISPPDKKPRLKTNEDVETESDSGDDISTSALIDMENRKIKSAERLTDAVCDIRDQMTRLIEVFVEIKDAILKRPNS